MKKYFSPLSLSLILILLFLGFTLAQAGGDPTVFAEIGTRFSENDPQGTEGYDGQFVYFIAQDMDPAQVAPLLDVPAYRYQRILLPLLANLLSFGQQNLVAWMIPLISLIAHLIGIWAVSQLLSSWGRSRWLALVYALWVGFMLALRLDLPEPLAYALIASALLAQQKEKKALSWVLYALAIFAKEVTILFLLAQFLYDLLGKRWKDAVGLSLIALLHFALFQLWLYQTFGAFGIGSGGAMATAFEWIPFMGIFRIGEHSMLFLAAILAVYTPTIILPVIWGIWQSVKTWRKEGAELLALGFLLNAVVFLFIPFSTYREPNGIFRLMDGLILSLLLFAAKYGYQKVLNYSYLYLVLNVFLLRL